MTAQPTITDTHTWDGTRTLPGWLTEHHHWDGEQLVIRDRDDTTPIQPGWTIVLWSDGVFTAASPRTAERAYGTDGLAGRLERAEAELQQHAENESADAAAGSYALRAEGVEARLARVAGLYEQWVKAGPPPLGVQMARWWDARLVELRKAIHEPVGLTLDEARALRDEFTTSLLAGRAPRTTVNNPASSSAPHIYLSTGCYHGDHAYCQSMTGLNGAKRPASCKKCGARCICPCHQQTDPPIGCLTVTAEATPSQRPGLRDDIAAALYERERPPRDPAWADAYAMDREVFEAMADAALAVLYREWPWLRAEAEERDQQATLLAAITAEAARRGVISIDGIRKITRQQATPPAPRDPCPYCEASSERIPRAELGQHIAEQHPDVKATPAKERHR